MATKKKKVVKKKNCEKNCQKKKVNFFFRAKKEPDLIGFFICENNDSVRLICWYFYKPKAL